MLIWCKYLYNNDNHNHNRVININFLHVKTLMRINTMISKGKRDNKNNVFKELYGYH